MSIRTVTIVPGASPSRHHSLLPLACLLTVGALLGISTNMAKFAASRGLDPLTLLIWSVTGASLLVTGANAVVGRRPYLNRRTAEYFAVAALVGIVAPNLLLYAAVPEVGAGFVAMSIAFPPLLTYLGALALGLERVDGWRALGVLVALAGATYLAYMKFSRVDAPIPWIAATMIAPVILAAGNIYRTTRWPIGATPQELAPGVLLAAAAALLVLGAMTEVPLRVRWHEPFDLLLIAGQTAVLAAQYLLFFILQQRGGPVLLSLLGAVAAVVGVPLAVLILGETPPAGLAPGATLIAVGTFVVILRDGSRNQRRQPT